MRLFQIGRKKASNPHNAYEPKVRHRFLAHFWRNHNSESDPLSSPHMKGISRSTYGAEASVEDQYMNLYSNLGIREGF